MLLVDFSVVNIVIKFHSRFFKLKKSAVKNNFGYTKCLKNDQVIPTRLTHRDSGENNL